MGILTTFIIAANDGAAALYNANEDFDFESWPPEDRFDSGSLLPMHIEMLWAILQGIEWDVDMMDAFGTVRNSEEEWLVRFPDDLVNRLAEASPTQLDSARVEWAETEELNCDPEDLEEVVTGLQGLAQRAVATQRPLYLWGSL